VIGVWLFFGCLLLAGVWLVCGWCVWFIVWLVFLLISSCFC